MSSTSDVPTPDEGERAHWGIDGHRDDWVDAEARASPLAMSLRPARRVRRVSGVVQDCGMILLTRNRIALVDPDILSSLAQVDWYVKGRYANTMRAAPRPGRHTRMHQAIAGYVDGLVIDHINGDGLDNRRKNLRPVRQSQNLAHAAPQWLRDSGGVRANPGGLFTGHVTFEGKEYVTEPTDDPFVAMIERGALYTRITGVDGQRPVFRIAEGDIQFLADLRRAHIEQERADLEAEFRRTYMA